MICVRQVPVDVVRPLRTAVLRPGQELAAVSWPGDDEPDSVHLAAYEETGDTCGVGTLVREPTDRPDTWRLRGMAVAASARGRGVGTAVLQALLERARADDAALVWCTARLAARSLYERAGFRAVGEIYDLPGIGPHLRMEVALATGGSSRAER